MKSECPWGRQSSSTGKVAAAKEPRTLRSDCPMSCPLTGRACTKVVDCLANSRDLELRGEQLRLSPRRAGNNWLVVISLSRWTTAKILSTLRRSLLLEKLSLLLEYKNIAMSSCLNNDCLI